MIGERFKSNFCGWYTVIEKIRHPKGYRWMIEFDEINGKKYRVITEKKHVLSGGVRNPYYPSKLGIACIGMANSKEHPKEFNKWRAMIERCYDENNNHYKTYGANGVRVCDRWLCFEYFLSDIKRLKGYHEEDFKNGALQLDKDILGNGKLYSPETCILVTNGENLKEMNERVKQKLFKATNITSGEVIFSNNQIELSKSLGVNQSNISHCIRGKQKSVRGYKIELINLEE